MLNFFKVRYIYIYTKNCKYVRKSCKNHEQKIPTYTEE